MCAAIFLQNKNVTTKGFANMTVNPVFSDLINSKKKLKMAPAETVSVYISISQVCCVPSAPCKISDLPLVFICPSLCE